MAEVLTADNLENQNIEYHKLNTEVPSRKRILADARRYNEAKQSVMRISAALKN